MTELSTQPSQTDDRIWFDPPLTQATLHGARRGQGTKDYLKKVAALVPVEVIAAYQALISFVPTVKPETSRPYVYWVCFVIGVLGTIGYTDWRIGKGWEKGKHLLVYVTAFVVWAYSFSGEKLFQHFAPYLYQDAFAGMLLIVASLALGKVNLPKRAKRP